MTEQSSKSLYQIIKEARLEEGGLPPDFELPKDRDENKIVFADGAMDGIIAFHSAGPGDVDIEPLSAALKTVSAGGADGEEKAFGMVEMYFQDNHALSVIDSIQSWVVEHKDELPPQKIFQFGLSLAANSTQAETVKFGLSLLELFDTESDESMRDFVFTLGLSDEFTLFALFLIGGWEDGNEKIWELARLLKGWGKVHAVERLQPNTEEIREWILCFGCENSILNNYVALTCALKCSLTERLRSPKLTDEEFRGASIILQALLEEGGPCAGIESFEDGDLALHRLLQHAAQRKADLSLLTLLLDIRDYYDELENEEDAEDGGGEESRRTEMQKQAGLCAAKLCRSLLEDADSTDIIMKEIRAGRPDSAVIAANRLSIDITGEVWKSIEEAPLERFSIAWYLAKDEQGARRLAELYENTLPLEEMASGVSDLLGVGEEYKQYNCLGYLLQLFRPYPMVGTGLVAAALNAPVVNNRTMASRVLVDWQEALQRPLKEFSPELHRIAVQNRELEEEGEHRDRLDQLL